MATVTAGTKLTTSLTAAQWQPDMSIADLATLNELIRNPVTGAYGASAAISSAYIENGILFLPPRQSSIEAISSKIQLYPGDWLMVDGAGWPIVVPDAIFSTSWQHS